MTLEITNIFRQKNGGSLGLEQWDYWGRRLVDVEDPEGIDVPQEWAEAIVLDGSRPKIPPKVWNAIVNLYISLMRNETMRELMKDAAKKRRSVDTGLEVACFFTLDEQNPGEGMQAWVPTQHIGHAHVEIEYEQPFVNILTGEKVDTIHALSDSVMKMGTTHSHNDMGFFFSGTDNKSELPQPGIHLVGGSFRQKKKNDPWAYGIASSIVLGGIRYEKVLDADEGQEPKVRDMTWEDLIEYDSKAGGVAHEDVWSVIQISKPLVVKNHGSYLYKDSRSLTVIGGGGCWQQELEDYIGVSWGRRTDENFLCGDKSCRGYVTTKGVCMECNTYSRKRDELYVDWMERRLEFLRDGNGRAIGYRQRTHSGSNYRVFMGEAAASMLERWGVSPVNKEKKNENKRHLPVAGVSTFGSRTHYSISISDMKSSLKEACRIHGMDYQAIGSSVRYSLKEFGRLCAFFTSFEDDTRKDFLKLMASMAEEYDLVFMDREEAFQIEEDIRNDTKETTEEAV